MASGYRCDYCRSKFYNKTDFDLHEEACFEAYEAKQREKEDALAEEIGEFIDAGFTLEQAEFLMSKYGSNS